MTPTAPPSEPVRRRQVYYVPGYDPLPPRRYRELYRSESARQAAITGYEIAVAGKPGAERYGWQVSADIDGQRTETTLEVLLWSDIVRTAMTQGIVGTYVLLAKTAWTYVSTGALRRLMWLRKGPVISALYPAVMLILQLLLSIAGGWIAGVIAAGVIWPPLFWPVALPVFVLLMRLFKRLDIKLYAHYLMSDYAFTALHNGATPPALLARQTEFADVIAAALTQDVDEVLIVGHSSGAQIALAVLADLSRRGRIPADGPALSLLTLGQVIPMVSFLPDAGQLRADLNLMAAQTRVPWIDISAPSDVASFALCDPVAVSGVAPDNKRWPLVISAAFTQTLAAETLRAIRWKFFRLHIQYLCAFDTPGEYDYFQITAGPMTLAQRFAHRKPSDSRIDVAASPYRSMTP